VLWSVAPSLVLFLLAYAAVGTLVTTTVFGKRLVQLQYLALQKEGDLRFDLVRTRENSGAPHTLLSPSALPAASAVCLRHQILHACKQHKVWRTVLHVQLEYWEHLQS
jgi:hypothetical protein